MTFNNLKKDFLASIVVFIVALPLCIGISIATGVPISMGLISGIIGGIVVGSLAGCPLQVSGPAAGLIMVVVEIIQQQGLDKLGLIVFMAGIIQVVFGIFSLGKWFRAISPAIIQGMLSGIGISILMSQLHVMLDASPKSNLIENILTLPSSVMKGIFPLDGSSHHIAAGIGILTIGIIFLWNAVPKKIKAIPATLVAVVFTAAITGLLNLPINHISISGNIFEGLALLNIHSFKFLLNPGIIIAAISIAFIASAETLLSSTAVDKMSCSKIKTNYNKEVLAQGFGNLAAGIVGSLPITGVIVRSATNIQAGASSRFSTILHGLWILIFICFFPFILNLIPTASLAAILVYIGYKLVNVDMAKKIYNFNKGEFWVYMITLTAILTTNLLEGIIIGFATALIKHLYKALKLNIHVESYHHTDKIIVKINGNVTFIRLPQIAEIIESIEHGKQVEINFEKLHSIDHACIDLLIDWSNRYMDKGGKVVIDWHFVKKVCPDFGWDAINDIYPDFNWGVLKKAYPSISSEIQKAGSHS